MNDCFNLRAVFSCGKSQTDEKNAASSLILPAVFETHHTVGADHEPDAYWNIGCRYMCVPEKCVTTGTETRTPGLMISLSGESFGINLGSWFNFFLCLTMIFRSYTVKLPHWVNDILSGSEMIYSTVEKRMELAIKLAANNILNNGGPFGAAVFEQYSGRLVAPGVNLVLQTNCSVVHAEIVAIILAQKKVANFDLGADGLPGYELVSTTEPCAMCLGAIPWSGIKSLVCGARDEDARSIGFDEGDKPDNWTQNLQSRSISVKQDILRDEAKAVLQQYVDAGGIIYNGRIRGTI